MVVSPRLLLFVLHAIRSCENDESFDSRLCGICKATQTQQVNMIPIMNPCSISCCVKSTWKQDEVVVSSQCQSFKETKTLEIETALKSSLAKHTNRYHSFVPTKYTTQWTTISKQCTIVSRRKFHGFPMHTLPIKFEFVFAADDRIARCADRKTRCSSTHDSSKLDTIEINGDCRHVTYQRNEYGTFRKTVEQIMAPSSYVKQ